MFKPTFRIEPEEGFERKRTNYTKTPFVKTAARRAAKKFKDRQVGQLAISFAYGDKAPDKDRCAYVFRQEEDMDIEIEVIGRDGNTEQKFVFLDGDLKEV